MIFEITFGGSVCCYVKAKNEKAAIHKAEKRGFLQTKATPLDHATACQRWQEMAETLDELEVDFEDLSGVLRMEGLL